MKYGINKKRQNKHKVEHSFFNTKSALGALFFIATLLLIAWSIKSIIQYMQQHDDTVISKLIIMGDRRLTLDDDIREAILSLGEDNSFIGLNVDKVRNEMMRYPWIKQISVRKQWPDMVKLHLVEYVPLAHWNDISLIDSDGNVFNVPPEYLEQEYLISFYGPEGSEKETVEMYKLFNSQLAQEKNLFITSLTVTERYAWKMVINNKINIELGRTDLNERLQRFIDVYQDIIEIKAKGASLLTIDLRYKSGMAIDAEKRD